MKPIISQNNIRSFGRVKGRKLRPWQVKIIEDSLPKYSLNINELEKTLTKIEGRNIWLEIGFGYGEHLAAMAQKYPDIYFIGCEPFINGVAMLLKYIEENKLTNISILHGDARILLEKLPVNSIERVFILFPDPWPKSKHHKKRIISATTLELLNKLIKNNGRLEIATDHVDYGNWIAEHIENAPYFKANEKIGFSTQPEDWVPTRYQQKAEAEGRGARFFNLCKSVI